MNILKKGIIIAFLSFLIIGQFSCTKEQIISPNADRTFGIRHDKDLAQYEALALNTGSDFPNFSSVVCFKYSLNGSNNQEYIGSGTLIAENWILTAGHNFYVAEEQKEPAKIEGITVIIGNNPNTPDKTYEVAELVFHPTWLTQNTDFMKANDLCLVRLKTPITDLTPIELYSDSTETIGSKVWFCGFGDYTRLEGQEPELMSNKHAIENILDRKIDGITTSINGTTYNGGLLAYDFDNPAETINSLGDGVVNTDEALLGAGTSAASPLDFEGATVQGDSGGPLFVKDGNTWKVAGVLSGGASEAIPNHHDASYGDISIFIRVSTAKDWILDAIQ